ncbi:hypothetical protein K461DRAFT_273019 [Myriangium duriaei CBS 260.36]|uniref:Uncharacterized protein n=1 Tax=Myriangium duriaei CBS 260.36 TaxID=1168546 RepID=A0A9P4MJA4_9PEZI|nr:hypothetical protein K461DRAFT_273019 [Myriangium duriaei CBS 260.36]
MQTTRRPVPSSAALKALRQLAYVASGTACGAAALVYEERRRRIHFLKQVAENGRAIRHAARHSRRGHATAAATASVEADADLTLDPSQVWDRRQFRQSWSVAESTESPKRRSENRSIITEVHAPQSSTRRSEDLPSQVDRGYGTLLSDHRQYKRLEAGLPRRVKDTGRGQSHGTSRPQHVVQSVRGSWFERSVVHRTQLNKPRSCIRSRIARNSAVGSQHQIHAYSQNSPEGLEDSIRQWSIKLSAVHIQPQSLDHSWQILLESTRRRHDNWVLDLVREPESILALAKAAADLRLPDLLLGICLYASDSGQMQHLIGELVHVLGKQPNPQIFSCVSSLLLDWIASIWSTSSFEPHSPLDLRWFQIRLLMMTASEEPEKVDNWQSTLSTLPSERRSHDSNLCRIFEDAIRLGGIENALQETQNAVSDMISTGVYVAAARLHQECIRSECVGSEQAKRISKPILLKLQESHLWSPIAELVRTLHIKGVQTEALILDLWLNCKSDMDLLDIFESFQLRPVPDQVILARLFDAMTKHYSGEVIISEVYGPRSRLWASVLAREWESYTNLDSICNRFWALQKTVGDRLLSPILYDVVIRKCRLFGREEASNAVSRFREDLMFRSRASIKVSVILQLGQTSKWDLVFERLKEIKVSDFGTMQVQQRAQMFDPLILAYATKERSPRELFKMSVAVFTRIYEYITPTQSLRLLAMSLVRNGQVATLIKVHDYSSSLLRSPMLLTPIDAVELFRSFYYGHRPSHVGLAGVMYKTFHNAWQSVSRFCLPLLLISASYESKKQQQKRIVEPAQKLIKTALMQMDNPELRDALVLEARRMGSCDGVVSLDLSKATGVDGNRKGSDTLLGKFVNAASTFDGAEHPQTPSTGTSSASSVSRNAMSGAVSSPASFVRPEPRLPAVESTRAQFMHARNKALLHNAQIPGQEADITTLAQGLGSHNAFSPSATIASLVANSHVTEPQFLRNLLETAGSDMSLSESREAISKLQSTEIDSSRFCSKEMLVRLKAAIVHEYERLEMHGQVPNHSLATALGQVMLEQNKPAAAIELVGHALNSHWGKIIKPGMGPMLILLKAYIALGHIDGVRWVAGHVLSRNERVEKSFITALKHGRQLWMHRLEGRANKEAQVKLVQELARLQKICVEQQAKQIARRQVVGEQLAAYIGTHSAPVDRVAWSADDEFDIDDNVGKSNAHDTQRFKDAVLVQSVCADVLTMAKTKHSRNKAPASLDGNSKQLRLVRAMRKAESVREQRGRGVEVSG